MTPDAQINKDRPSKSTGSLRNGGFTFWGLVMKGIKRRTFRNAVTILTFAVVTGTLLASFFLVGGAENSAMAGMNRLGADLMVVPEQYQYVTDTFLLTGKPSTFYFNSSMLQGVGEVPGVDRISYQTYIATLNAGCCAFPTQLVAFDAAQDFTIQPWVKEGLGRTLQKDEIILGSAFIGGGVGFHLIFYGHDFTVAGILDATGTGIDRSVFIQYADAIEMANDSKKLAVHELSLKPGQVSSVLVKLRPGVDGEAVAKNITDSVAGSTVITSNHLARAIDDNLSGTVSSLYLTAASVALVAVPLISAISSMVANERRWEMGLLRAMGADRRFILMVILVEAVLLATVGALLGAAAAGFGITLFQTLITTSLGIPFLWPSMASLIIQISAIMCLAIFLGSLAALVPAIKTIRMDPYESMRGN
jgi:putative ABC transport system permease protein